MSSTVANDLENKIIQWLNAHGNKIELNISEGSFEQYTPTIYGHTSPGTYISIGFKQPLQKGLATPRQDLVFTTKTKGTTTTEENKATTCTRN